MGQQPRNSQKLKEPRARSAPNRLHRGPSQPEVSERLRALFLLRPSGVGPRVAAYKLRHRANKCRKSAQLFANALRQHRHAPTIPERPVGPRGAGPTHGCGRARANVAAGATRPPSAIVLPRPHGSSRHHHQASGQLAWEAFGLSQDPAHPKLAGPLGPPRCRLASRSRPL